jgi:ubiquinone biosynthesis protein COQ9
LVASQNQIGTYSYELEILESSEIVYSHPEGIAQHFFSQGHFDLAAFVQNYHEQMALHALAEIAKNHLQVDTLEDNPPLREALLEAYRYGKGNF